MFCNNCGTELETNSKFCPRCGAPVRSGQQEETPQPAAQQEDPQQPSGTQQTGTQQAGMSLNGEPSGKNRKKIIIPIVAAAAVVIVGVGAFAMTRSNFFRSRFSSPEEYYRSVEQEYINKCVESLSRDKDASANNTVTMSVAIEDAGLAMLGITGYSADTAVDGLNDLEIRLQTGEDGNIYGADAGLYTADGENLVSANAVIDPDSREMYVQIPELSEAYLMFDSEAYDSLGLEAMDVLSANAPDGADMAAVISTYTDIILDYMVNVERENTVISAGGIEQDAVLLNVTVSGRELTDMISEILENMENDETLEKWVSYWCDYMSLMGNYQYGGYYTGSYGNTYSYEAFVDGVRQMKEYLEQNTPLASAELGMEVWVNSGGEITGRSVTVSQGGVTLPLFSYRIAENNGEYGYELVLGDTADEYGEYIRIEGNGTQRADLADGVFTVETAGQAVAQIEMTDYNVRSAEDGYINGTFRLSTDVDPTLAGLGLEITIGSYEGAVSESFSVLSNDVPIATLNMEITDDSDYTPSLPSDSEVYNIRDGADMAEYESTMDIQGLMDRLRSNEFLDMVLSGASYYY